MQVGELALKQDMLMIGAGDIAGAAGPGAAAIESFMHRGEHLGVLPHAEVVVRAPDRHVMGLAAVVARRRREFANTSLQVSKNAVAPVLLQDIQLLSEKLFVLHFLVSEDAGRFPTDS